MDASNSIDPAHYSDAKITGNNCLVLIGLKKYIYI